MPNYVYYCYSCNKTFSGEGRKVCPNCEGTLTVMPFSLEVWRQKSDQEKIAERQKMHDEIDALQKEREERTRAVQIALTEQASLRTQRDEIALKINDIYEYDIDIIRDKKGATNVDYLRASLIDHSSKGWRLVALTTNELGVESTFASYGGTGFGLNSTQDETVLIYERKIKERQ